jgi:hypothetical protein
VTFGANKITSGQTLDAKCWLPAALAPAAGLQRRVVRQICEYTRNYNTHQTGTHKQTSGQMLSASRTLCVVFRMTRAETSWVMGAGKFQVKMVYAERVLMAGSLVCF